jgi:mannose-6-phosphate isomerase-like protein (cupin superfamily)
MSGGAVDWHRAAAPGGQAMKRGYCDNIERETVGNEDFRRVLYTGEHLQLVLMTLQPGEEIGEEVHPDRDQFFRIEEGEGAVDINGVENRVEDDFAVIVPAGARHNVRNIGAAPLRFYTLYGPPEHKDGVVRATKAEADDRHNEEEWDGATTE